MTGKSFLFGYSVISSGAENAEKIINLCNENEICFSKPILESEKITFFVPLFQERKFVKCTKEEQIEVTVLSRKGIPALCLRYRARAGILVGLVASIIIFAFSSGLVWDIRIDGATAIDKNKLRACLADCGLHVGTKLEDIDADVLENQILILSDDISWISVNVSNNVANVEVRELEFPTPDEYGDALYSNVVASQSGVIVGFEDVNGCISVDIGEAVCKDQLLISGILGGEGAPTRLTNAQGRVLAEVDDIIKIEIPQKYVKKVTKSQVKTEKSIIFFKKEIKFFSNSRNLPPFYDTIDIVENFYSINQKKLPVALKTVKYIEYENCEFSRSKSEMLSLAYSELYRYIDEHYSDSEILSRSVSFIENNDSLTLVCNLRCIKNIGVVKEIIVN